MLVLKVEIWPGGERDRAYEISRVGIVNTSGVQEFSDYEMTALMDRGSSEYVLRAEVNKHERSLGWEPLVQRSMTALFLSERLAHGVPYDDPVAELLRKDICVRRNE